MEQNASYRLGAIADIVAHEAAVAAKKGECDHARALSERARLSFSESGYSGAEAALKKFIAPYLQACQERSPSVAK